MTEPWSSLPVHLRNGYRALTSDLSAVFGPRLAAAVAFGQAVRAIGAPSRHVRGDSLALVDWVAGADLVACAGHARRWHAEGLRMPLLLGRDEFGRSLDVFPLEYDDIVAHHVLLVGADPFVGIAVAPDDIRRACEARTKGHLVHLREGFLEARGEPRELADLIVASAPALSALFGNLARLRHGRVAHGAAAPDLLAEIPNDARRAIDRILGLEANPTLGADEAAVLYPAYLAGVEHLAAWVDAWSRS